MNLKFLRRHATSIVLAVLAAVFAVILLVVDRGSVSTGEAEHRKRNLFDAWRPDDITELSLSAQGKSAQLGKSAPDDAGHSAWSVQIDGQRFPADEQAVDQLLGTLEFAVFERRLDPSSVDRAAMQLDNPALSIALRMGRQTYRLLVSGSAPTPPGAAYAQVEGRGVFVITGQLKAALNIAPERLRSKSLLPYFSSDLSGIHLDGKGGPRHFIRAPWGGSGSGGFRFDGSTPEGLVRVNAHAIDKLFTTLGRLQAEAFLSDAEADRLGKAEVKVTLLPRDSAAKPGILEMGGPCPGRDEHVIVIRREPSRASACVPKSTLEELSTPAADFVDRTLLGAPLQEITEVSVIRGDRKVELARKGTQWHQRAPTDRDVEAAIGEGFIETLRKVNASGFLSDDPGKLGLSPPQATVRIVSITPGAAPGGGDIERTELLEVGAEQGDEIAIRRAEDGMIAAVPRELAAPLLSGELALRSRSIFKVPIQEFASLRIVEAHGRTQHVIRTKEGAWRLAEPQGKGLAADLGLASAVAEVLGALQAERWVAAEASASHGLDQPRIIIEATLGRERGEEGSAAPSGDEGPPETIRIELGAPTADGSFARRDGDPTIFVAPKVLEAAASRWLLDRAVFHMDPSEMVRATLSADGGKRKLTVEHEGNVWRIRSSAPDDAASNARAAALRDALGDLMAEGAVTVGKAPKQEGLDKPELTLEVERKKREPLKMVIGAGDSFRGTSIRYARRAGLDVTYAIAQSKVRPLLEAVQR